MRLTTLLAVMLCFVSGWLYASPIAEAPAVAPPETVEDTIDVPSAETLTQMVFTANAAVHLSGAKKPAGTARLTILAKEANTAFCESSHATEKRRTDYDIIRHPLQENIKAKCNTSSTIFSFVRVNEVNRFTDSPLLVPLR